MQDSNIPAKFSIPFANGAGAGYIRTVPQASQISVQNGAASLTDGFPPDCFISIAAGGSWPFGQDFNGLLNQSTAWNRWQAAGGPVTYDATFSSGIGGYPKGAVLMNANMNGWWRNTVDNNTTNPDTGGANWVTFGGKYVGEVFAFAGAVAPALCYPCDGRALSRSTYSLLFAAIGTTWGSGDGSTTFNIPDLRGRALAGADNLGGTAANRMTVFSATLGAVGGDQNLQVHLHGIAQTTHSHTAGDSGHNHEDLGHGHRDPGHNHGDGGHNHGDWGHGHGDSGHGHGAGDYGHQHSCVVDGGTLAGGTLEARPGWTDGATGWGNANIYVSTGYASIQTGYANIGTGYANIGTGYANLGTGYASIGTGYASIYTNGAYAGIGNTNNSGSGGSANIQPTAVVNYYIFANA
jgi:microcystin-dependent protein